MYCTQIKSRRVNVYPGQEVVCQHVYWTVANVIKTTNRPWPRSIPDCCCCGLQSWSLRWGSSVTNMITIQHLYSTNANIFLHVILFCICADVRAYNKSQWITIWAQQFILTEDIYEIKLIVGTWLPLRLRHPQHLRLTTTHTRNEPSYNTLKQT